MLARRCTTMLPAMTLPEAIETTRLYGVAGVPDGRTALVTTPPFHDGLSYSIVISIGNGSYRSAIRQAIS